MITTLVEYNPDKLRYELTFNNGKVEWYAFLFTEVIKDPERFSNWLTGLINTLLEKERLS